MKNKIRLALVVLALGASALIGRAQDDNDGPGGPPPGEDGGGPGGPLLEEVGGGGPSGAGDINRSGGSGGNFDPAQFEQRLLEQTRKNLNVTNDDEWTAIKPLVEKVMAARRAARTGGGMGMIGLPGGPNGPGGPNRQASAEQQALQSAIEANAPVAQIKEALAKLRAAQKVKQGALESNQNDLRNVLNVKQEAQAVLMGLLQ